MGDADATSEALGANNPLACLFAVCPFDPAKVMPMEFDFRPHMIDNKVKDQESGKSKDAGDQANASPGKSKVKDKESGKQERPGGSPRCLVAGPGAGQKRRQGGSAQATPASLALV